VFIFDLLEEDLKTAHEEYDCVQFIKKGGGGEMEMQLARCEVVLTDPVESCSLEDLH
jgi:hypothetical protein